MKEGFEKIVCPVCSSEDTVEFISTYDRFNKDLEFKIKKCKDCKFVFLNPRPDANNLGKYYNVDGYDPFLSTEKKFSIRDKFYVFLRTINLAGKFSKISKLKKKAGKILDIGCATGEFLEKFGNHHWQCTGVEVDENARNIAKSKDIKVYPSVHKIPETETFDVITMWHVLEHVHDLNESIKKITSLLKADGYLVIAVPNIDSYDAQIYGKDWIALDTPRHLYHYSEETITHLMSNYRIEMKKFHPLFLDILYNNLMSKSLSNTGFIKFIKTLFFSITKTYLGSRKNSSTLVYYFQKEK